MSEIVKQAKNPLLIFSDKLRIRRAEAEEAEVSFDDTDILAVAMDALMESGWQSPNALSTALENARKDALEEAAKVCDKQEEYSRKIGEGDDEFWSSHHATAMKTASILAASIRSLTPPTEKAT